MSEEGMVPEVEMAPAPQSYLVFLFKALGIRYAFLLPAAALLSFVVVLFLVLRGKGNALPGALLFIVPLPFLIGCIGVVDGLLSMLQVISRSAVTDPAAWATGLSMSLATAWVGAIFTIPNYLLATIGLIARSFDFRGSDEPHDLAKR